MFKPFDPQLYNKNDTAKYDAIKYLEKLNKKAYVNPDQYGVDLIVDDAVYCEVEVKHAWKGKEFPFSTLQIPERKTKFTKADKPVMFMVFNSDRSYAFLVKGDDVMKSPLKHVPNKYMDDEMFFQIPVNKLTKVRIS